MAAMRIKTAFNVPRMGILLQNRVRSKTTAGDLDRGVPGIQRLLGVFVNEMRRAAVALAALWPLFFRGPSVLPNGREGLP
jgi:hypothetical protein